jgi:hypothetical protein
MVRVRENDQNLKQAVGWACMMLLQSGCTLHSVGHDAWDVEMADGSWRAVNSSRELVDLAGELNDKRRKVRG